MKPIVYICSPYAGDVEINLQNARNYCRFAAVNGAIPLAVHLFFPQFLNDSIPAERELGIDMGLSLLRLCSEIWVFGSHVSNGMRKELAFAQERILVRYFDNRCMERL